MRFQHYNPNPSKRNVGDCTVRAISKALGQDWYRTYLWLCIEGAVRSDMPSANATWGAYLRRHGFRRDMAPEDMTVATLYTIKNQMNKQDPESHSYEQAYSAAPAAEMSVDVGRYGDSEFLREVEGKDQEQVWGIIALLLKNICKNY